jgi:hypothetical protein
MKIKHKILGVFIVAMLLFSFKIYQNQSQDNVLIIGTWIEENSTYDYRWVINSTQVLKYSDNKIYGTYIWQINESTTNGLTSSYLKLTNVQDPSDISEFEISGLDDENLSLVFQRLGGGIGKMVTYIRQ